MKNYIKIVFIMIAAIMEGCSSTINTAIDNMPSLYDIIDSGKIVDSMPKFWSSYSWEEISEDEAKSLYQSYNTATPPSSKLTQYTKKGDKPIRAYYDLTIEKSQGHTRFKNDPLWDVSVYNTSMTLNDYPAYDETITRIYRARENQDVLKFSEINEYGYENLHILDKAWQG